MMANGKSKTRFWTSGVFTAAAFAALFLAQGQGLSQDMGSAAPDTEKALPGEKISLDLKSMDIAEVLKMLSLKTGYAVIPSKNVSGKVLLFLRDVTPMEALDVILLSQGLAYEKKDNTVMVMTADEYEKLYGKKFNERRIVRNGKLKYASPGKVAEILRLIKSTIGEVVVDQSTGTFVLIDTPDKIAMMENAITELDAPLETVTFDLQYANAATLKDYIGQAVTPDTGKVIIDERMNKIMVSDLPDRIKKIRRMIEALDEESRQVEIEARIIQLTYTKKFDRGIEWTKLMPGMDDAVLTGSFGAQSALANYGRITMGALGVDGYTTVMNFLQTLGDIKTISTPRILAVNNEEAKIMVGSREAYVTQTTSQGQTTLTSENVEFIDVGIKLSVIPTINKNGMITMKIKPEISSTKEPLVTALKSVIPIVETSEAETTVQIQTGNTLMIAGLMKFKGSDSRKGGPGTLEAPVLSGLTSNRAQEDAQSELIVFLTPRLAGNKNDQVASAPGIEAAGADKENKNGAGNDADDAK